MLTPTGTTLSPSAQQSTLTRGPSVLIIVQPSCRYLHLCRSLLTAQPILRSRRDETGDPTTVCLWRPLLVFRLCVVSGASSSRSCFLAPFFTPKIRPSGLDSFQEGDTQILENIRYKNRRCGLRYTPDYQSSLELSDHSNQVWS